MFMSDWLFLVCASAAVAVIVVALDVSAAAATAAAAAAAAAAAVVIAAGVAAAVAVTAAVCAVVLRRRQQGRGSPGGPVRARGPGVQPREADAEKCGATGDGHGQERRGARVPVLGHWEGQAQFRRRHRQGVYVCVLRIEALFLPVDMQHIQCPCWFFSLSY